MPRMLIGSSDDSLRFFRASLLCARALDAKLESPRWFGAEADAAWASFRGQMGVAERVEMVLRDATAQSKGAFSPRVLAGESVDELDPIEAGWPTLDEDTAGEMWRKSVGAGVPGSRGALLREIAGLWGASVVDVNAGSLSGGVRVAVAGASAIVAVAEAVERDRGAWATQVYVVASSAADRHLAALAAPVLGSMQPTTFVSDVGALRGRIDRIVISDDANEVDAAMARTLGEG